MNVLMRRRVMVQKKGGDSILPAEFQQVEWIGIPTSGARPYIDTGIVANATVYRMVAKYKHTVGGDYYGLSTRLGDGSNNQLSFFGYYNTTYSEWAWRSYFYGPQSYLNHVHEADATFRNGSQEIVFDGTNYTYSKTGDFNGTMTFYIFGRHHDGDTIGTVASGMRFYYLKMYLDDVLVRDYIPCYRKSDGEIGMYDLVSNSFFTNAGSGTFEKGNDV